VNVVDFSRWLEYLADGPNADFFAKSITTTAELVLWSQDSDFENIAEVRYIAKK
jgi:hypothetical protein